MTSCTWEGCRPALSSDAGAKLSSVVIQFTAILPHYDILLACRYKQTVLQASPLMANDPRCVADKDAKDPWKAPNGVRTAPTMHTSAALITEEGKP